MASVSGSWIYVFTLQQVGERISCSSILFMGICLVNIQHSVQQRDASSSNDNNNADYTIHCVVWVLSILTVFSNNRQNQLEPQNYIKSDTEYWLGLYTHERFTAASHLTTRSNLGANVQICLWADFYSHKTLGFPQPDLCFVYLP